MNSPSVLSLAARNAVLGRCTVLARCTALAMIGLGAFLRTHAFGFPNAFLFDEQRLVLPARAYLTHASGSRTPPPLADLIIARSMQLLGDHALGWRAPALLFGALTVVAGTVAAARLFRNRDAGLLTAGLLCADGVAIAYSRTALLDGFLAACVVAALWIASLRLTLASALLGGVLAGVACSLDPSGLVVIVPLALAAVLHPGTARQHALHVATLLGMGTLVYLALYAYGLGLAPDPVAAREVVQDTTVLFEHHVATAATRTPGTLGWFIWLVAGQPLVLGFALEDGSVRALSTLGNVLIGLSSIALALTALAAIAARGLRASLALYLPMLPRGDGLRPAAFVAAHGRTAVLTLSTALASLLTGSSSHVHQFLPTYACLILLLGGYAAHVLRQNPVLAALLLLLTLTVSVFYAPLCSFIPLSQHAYEVRLFVPTWR